MVDHRGPRPAGYCSPRRRLPFNSRRDGSTMRADDVAHNICSPSHRLPFNSRRDGCTMRVDDVANHICSPRHWLPFICCQLTRDVMGSTCVSMTWRAISGRGAYRVCPLMSPLTA